MQNNGMGGNGTPQLPIFKGVNYQFWSLKLSTLFRSQELRSLVEDGFEDDQPAEPDHQLREKRKKDSKALFMIQQALDDVVFPRIASARTSKQAWDTLKQEYLGDKKVIEVRLQSLRREFETSLMKEKESVQEYLSRVSSIVQQMRSYGEEITDQHVVGKVLRSLTTRFDHVVAAIEESKDMCEYTFDELMGSLQAHEERLNRSKEKKEETAFQAKGDSSGKEKSQNNSGRGGGRNGSRGRGRGKGQSNDGREQASRKGPIKCYYCNKPGHKEASCWKKDEDMGKKDQRSNYVEKEDKLFLAKSDGSKSDGGIWYIDSGCSNHMSSTKAIFKNMDGSKTGKVKLGDGKQLDVEGKGTIVIHTQQGTAKHLHDVQYVPHLAHNLLSVGQLLSSGYSILFEDDCCMIREKGTKEIVVRVPMGMNKMFSLNLSGNVSRALTVKGDDDAKLWHLRYGHLNMQGLKLLKSKEMVHGLTKMGELELCEGCVYGKQARGTFPSGKAWRANNCLELLHADLCGPMQTESLGGSKYFFLITDDYSRFSWVYFLNAKAEAFENFKKFKALVGISGEANWELCESIEDRSRGRVAIT
ncbi:hypothetical protein AAC387_Pa04g2305 [Persea americana]